MLKNSLLSLIIIFLLFSCKNDSLSIKEQGSFLIGGNIMSTQGEYNSREWMNPQGQTRHGDHAYVFYQIPVHMRKLPIVFLHGAWQSGKTWESTPDGRDGFQNIFLRHGFSTYVLDQPRRGRAGQTLVAQDIIPKEGAAVSFAAMPATVDQFSFEIFRLGLWPNYYENVQFPQDKESLNQFLRQTTPDTGPFDSTIISDSVSALFDKIGPGILFTHSAGGGPGWETAIKNPHVKAIVSFEPGAFPFPQGETPAPMQTSAGILKAEEIPLEDFMKLTQIPIVLYYGDNIPEEETGIPAQDNWYMRLKMAQEWVAAINDKGGNATLIHLPKIGIYGNTHFLFADLNNLEIANSVLDFLKKESLDK